MNTKRCFPIFAAAAALLMLAGCKSTTTAPTVPTPPQLTTANGIATFASALRTATHAVVSAKANGTISVADAATLENAFKVAAITGRQMEGELRSTTDIWCATNITAAGCQQGKLLGMLQSLGLSQLNAHISQSAQVLVAALLTAANALSASLGGPVI